MTAFFDGVEYTKGVVARQAEIDRKIVKEREKTGDSSGKSSERKNKSKMETETANKKTNLAVNFSNDLQEWFDNTSYEERAKSGKRFHVGTTTEVLKSIGVKDCDIYFGAAKISKILGGNSAMSLDIIKQAVTLLENPILIMESQTVADSIVIFGEVFTEDNKPVMISLLLNPKNKNGEILDYAVITSAYGRRIGNIQGLIDKSKIYYVNEQKKQNR